MVITWASLVQEKSEWEKLGYEKVDMNQVIGKTLHVCDYQLFDSHNYGEGVRILLSDDDNIKKFVATFGTAIVRAFKEHPEEVKALIENKVPLIIIESKTNEGQKFYTFQ